LLKLVKTVAARKKNLYRLIMTLMMRYAPPPPQVKSMMYRRADLTDEIPKMPDFLVALRPHTVWEKTPVRLFCTVQGNPRPIVKWSECVHLQHAALFKLKASKCNREVVTLGLKDDTAEYSAVATNQHGTATSKATVTVKMTSRFPSRPAVPRLTQIHPSKLEVSLLDRFSVSFGVEGGSISLVCSMVVVPDLPNLPPLVQWFRDDKLLTPGQLAEMTAGGGAARLTLPHLAKDDEGLYTLRIFTQDGTAEHSAYLFVSDAAPSVAGAPGAPMSVKAYDVNADYVLVAWKPPNTVNEAPITGYFVDRREAGSDAWVQCNDAPVKVCKYPVHGLKEGRSYHFRVRAVNAAGVSRPSRETGRVTALDAAEDERLQVIKIEGKYDVVIKQDDLEGHVTIPLAPTDVHASEVLRSYVVLSWTPPSPRGRAPLCYVIEKVPGTGAWQRINAAVALHSPRFPVFDLQDGLKYEFRVYSVNRHGASGPSEPSGPVQKGEEDGAPSAPGQVVSTRNTKSSVFVQWEPPKHLNNLVGYYIDGRAAGTKDWFPCNHKPFKHCRFVVHGLTPGESYTFRVQAANVFGLSEESQESSPISVEPALASPSAPFGITLLSCDGSSMTLAWKSPKHCGGSKVTAYYLDHRHADALLWREVNQEAVREEHCSVDNLTEGTFYEFKIQAANMAGVGVASAPSAPLKCEAWTMEEPGPAYDLSFSEVRGRSLVLLWKAPVYTGAGPVTGYLVDMAKKGSSEFITLTQEAESHRYLQVSGLEEGETYVFRVRSVNSRGVGRPSDLSEPVCAKALPGTQEIVAGVDEVTGDVFLSLEACEICETSKFVWSKNYKAIGDCPRVVVTETGRSSRMTFTNPDKDDLGRYSVAVTDTDGVSSSQTLTEDGGVERLLSISSPVPQDAHQPFVPLKHGLNYEILEKGHVRFWLQAVKLSPAVSYRFIVNDKEVKTGEGIKISHDVATGVIQMTVDHFTRANEGTYTVQIHDGKAKTQSSLVLVGDVFKVALKEAEFQRKEHIRKQGPHFSEYLYFTVRDDCTVMLACKVANVKKETSFHWYKEDDEIVPETPPNVMSGACALPIPLFSRKDQGVFKAVLSDDRGKDTSLCQKQPFVTLMWFFSGASASELVLQCTPEGIRLQCYMNYYTEEMKTVWKHKESKIASSEKMRIGGTAEMAWMQICDPSDKEKGSYTIEVSDGVQTHARTFDLSGQVHSSTSCTSLSSDRGRVVGGLPDVVTIMEEKSLSLTCTVWGEPTPEVSWFKNEQEVASTEHTKVTFEGGKFASMVITKVTPDDSGKYSINVRNKYGGEFVEITVSVYKHGEKLPEPKLGQPKAPAAAATPAPPKSPATPTKTATPSKSQTPASMKSPTPASTPVPKSPTPTPKSPTPTQSRGVKSPTPTRSMKSPTPPRK
uniref:Myomesin 2a n=1 Tax=Cyclopterus lumpus TaxID=8103 RepID=A0A8C2WKP0_CYCLU